MCKSILLPLAKAAQIFPEYEARISAMVDDEWYEWDIYIAMLSEIQSKLSPQTMVAIGFNLIKSIKPHLLAAGLDTIDKLLSDTARALSTMTSELPPGSGFWTAEFKPGRAVVEAGTARPAKLMEGYLRGVVSVFGKVVDEFDMTTIERDGNTVHRFTISWI